MHPKVVGAGGWKVVKALASPGLLRGWTLAGGTGLALQLGHRVSEDFDFFRKGPFDVDDLVRGLADHGKLAIQGRARATLHAVLDGVRLSFFGEQAPLLFAGTPYRGLVLADVRDIAVMKVVAIGGRGSRRDFVDLVFYLRSGGDLETLLRLVRRRFTGIDYNEYHLLKSLVFFDDAEAEPMPRLLRRVRWAEVKRTITSEVRRIS